MQVKIFSISIFDEGGQAEELNVFLRSHSIIDVEKYLVSSVQSPIWTFCVRYKENSNKKYKGKARIDYRDVLDEKTFNIFSKLRTYRKKIAEERGVPVFAVFTNEELANISKLGELNEQNVNKVEGIGQKRIEKYGKAILKLYNAEKK